MSGDLPFSHFGWQVNTKIALTKIGTDRAQESLNVLERPLPIFILIK
jgi:hypothetical protein